MRKLTDKSRKKLKIDLGKDLKKWRVEQGMTQTDLGRVLQLHQSAIARVEMGVQSMTAEQLVWLQEQTVHEVLM